MTNKLFVVTMFLVCCLIYYAAVVIIFAPSVPTKSFYKRGSAVYMP